MQQPSAGGAGGSQTHYGGAGEMSAAEAAAAEQGQLVVEAASPISSRPPASAAVNLDELMTLSGTAAAAEDAFADRGGGGGSSGNRWPRQETLALLKIRSDMDVAFRGATLKGPLWEDVSRKLAELGYQRNAKKCKEKFENVHKYYKRTKEGRAGRQDGKSYKFFSEMGALHGTAATAAATTANVSASPAVHVASPNPVSVGLGSVSNPMPISSFSMSQQQQPPPVTAIPIIPSSQPTASPMDFNFSSNSSSTSPGTDDEDDDDDVEGERSSRKRKRGSASTSTGISGGGRTRKMMDFSEVLMKQVMQKQESSSSPSSSSSSTTSSSSPYDVFLSFSEDTRKTFTDHLYWTMKDDGIDFFMEENESIRSGENISDKVKQIIEGSKVSVIVFSNRYADSIWCLEELVQIMECRRTLKQMVLPIFFDLSPSDVIGTFVLAFLKHRERFHEDTDIQERLRRWTDALTAAAGLTVRVFRTTNGYEGMFIREIIAEITVGIACPDPQRLDSPELEDVDSTERTDIGSSVSSAISPLYLAPLKEKLHEPDRSDSTSRSRKFSETRFLETREVRVRADFCPDDDGYRWRKYGQKDVLGWSYPRSYYKCAYRNTQGCGAIKQVQRDQDDPAMLIVMYRGVHVCRATNPEFAGEKGEIQKSGLEQLRSGLLQQPRRSTKRYRPLKDGPANSVGDVVPNIGSPLQAGGPILPCGDTDMLIKQRQKQQLLQHAPSNQQSQNSNLNPHQQDKMGGAGSITMDEIDEVCHFE